MSKLMKFAGYLTPEDAAKYLSLLINETVTIEDIDELFLLEWLPAELPAACLITKLEPFYDAQTHEQQARLGHFLMKDAGSVGTSYGIQFPCSVVMLQMAKERREVFTMRDEQGGFYALYDVMEEQYHPILSQEGEEVFNPNQLRYKPEDLHKIAEIANSIGPAPQERTMSRKQITSLISDCPLFNLMPNEAPIKPKPEDKKNVAHEAPSNARVVAALLELLGDSDRRRLNQAGVIDAITERFPEKRGLGKRTLETVFANARRQWNED